MLHLLDMWGDVNQNVDNLFHMLDEQTPIKDCSLDESSCQAPNLSGMFLTDIPTNVKLSCMTLKNRKYLIFFSLLPSLF